MRCFLGSATREGSRPRERASGRAPFALAYVIGAPKAPPFTTASGRRISDSEPPLRLPDSKTKEFGVGGARALGSGGGESRGEQSPGTPRSALTQAPGGGGSSRRSRLPRKDTRVLALRGGEAGDRTRPLRRARRGRRAYHAALCAGRSSPATRAACGLSIVEARRAGHTGERAREGGGSPRGRTPLRRAPRGPRLLVPNSQQARELQCMSWDCHRPEGRANVPRACAARARSHTRTIALGGAAACRGEEGGGARIPYIGIIHYRRIERSPKVDGRAARASSGGGLETGARASR